MFLYIYLISFFLAVLILAWSWLPQLLHQEQTSLVSPNHVAPDRHTLCPTVSVITVKCGTIYCKFLIVILYALFINSRALAAQGVAGWKPHAYRNWRNQRKPCIEIGNPCILFFMVFPVRGICSRAHGVSVYMELDNVAPVACLFTKWSIKFARLPWLTGIISWSIDSCQNNASTNQYHLPISRAQVQASSRSCVFEKLTADQVMDFNWIAGSSSSQIIKTSQNFEAPLLGLAKSIYYMTST